MALLVSGITQCRYHAPVVVKEWLLAAQMVIVHKNARFSRPDYLHLQADVLSQREPRRAYVGENDHSTRPTLKTLLNKHACQLVGG